MNLFEQKYESAGNLINSLDSIDALCSDANTLYYSYTQLLGLINNVPESEISLKRIMVESISPAMHTFVNELEHVSENKTRSFYSSDISFILVILVLLTRIQEYNAGNMQWYSRFENDSFVVIERLLKQKNSTYFTSRRLHKSDSVLGDEFDELVNLCNLTIGVTSLPSVVGGVIAKVITHCKEFCDRILNEYDTCSSASGTVNVTEMQDSDVEKISLNVLDSLYADICSTLIFADGGLRVCESEILYKTYIKTILYFELVTKTIDIKKRSGFFYRKTELKQNT